MAPDLFLFSSHHGALTSEGLYRYVDQAGKAPPLALALNWLNQHRLSVVESRLVNVVLSETLARRRGFAAISYRQLLHGIGLTPGPFSRMKVDPALARLRRAGILRVQPGNSNGRRGRPANLWRLGLLDQLFADAETPSTTEAPRQEVFLATKQPVFLAMDSVAHFPTRSQRTRAKRRETSFSLFAPAEIDSQLSDVPSRQQIFDLWQAHQGWERWPADRRHDAKLITENTRDHSYPLAFWQLAIKRVPKGMPFRWLTHPPEPGRVGRLEQWFLEWRGVEQPAPRSDDVALLNFKRLLGLPA